MHPSKAHQWGLRTDADIAIAELAIADAKKNGCSDQQIDSVGQFYGTLAQAVDLGQLSPQAALHQINDYAKLAGVGDVQRAGFLDFHKSTVEFIDSHPGQLPELDRPSPETVRAERAEIERIMSEDMPRYQRDEAMKNKYHDLIAASQVEAAPAKASKAHMRRLGELEKMMGDYNSPYWNPKIGPSLQAELRTILDMRDPRPPSVALAAPQSSGRRAEIEKMVGDQNSAYWRGPQANEIQNEYRALIAAPSAASTPADAGNSAQNGE
jgi:hypothetical protein